VHGLPEVNDDATMKVKRLQSTISSIIFSGSTSQTEMANKQKR